MVSIVGADDAVNPEDLLALSKEFPFVEWGVIFSRNSCGLKPRYPSLEWMARLEQLDVQTCMHLCGHIVRQIAPKDKLTNLKPLDTALCLLGNLKRIQLNLSPYVPDYVSHQTLLEEYAVKNQVSLILQNKTFNDPNVQASIHEYDHWMTPISFLHDASGGHGRVGEFEPPVEDAFTGYAGGIRPDNLVETMDRIYATGLNQPFWIDMESGVRTDNQFDLDKVYSILSQAKQWIEV